MSASHASAQARRVVTGLDASGRSTIVSDEFTSARLMTPGNTKCDIWRLGSLPANLRDEDGLDAGVLTAPPPAGLVHRVVTIPPDSEWDRSVGYSDANGPLPGTISLEESGGIPGMHITDTLDFVTVLSGELHAVLEEAVTVLRPGDTIVMRGVKHSWSNPTDQATTIVSVMIDAAR
jgi:hypothetical protein